MRVSRMRSARATARAKRSLAGPAPLAIVAAVTLSLSISAQGGTSKALTRSGGVPTFQVDVSWPQKLPNNWVMGVPSWVAVDRRDHVWVLHRPRTAPEPQRANAAPAVIEFDPS